MSDADWPIEITLHAAERMQERGASEVEVRAVVLSGTREPAEHGRWIYRDILPFQGVWHGRTYTARDIAVVVAEEPDRDVVITVYVFYVQSGGEP